MIPSRRHACTPRAAERMQLCDELALGICRCRVGGSPAATSPTPYTMHSIHLVPFPPNNDFLPRMRRASRKFLPPHLPLPLNPSRPSPALSPVQHPVPVASPQSPPAPQTNARTATLGQHALRVQRPLLLALRASSDKSSGGPTGCTNVCGAPRFADASRYAADGVMSGGKRARLWLQWCACSQYVGSNGCSTMSTRTAGRRRQVGIVVKELTGRNRRHRHHSPPQSPFPTTRREVSDNWRFTSCYCTKGSLTLRISFSAQGRLAHL
ncbi:hypothetical protein C8R44DRAFT_760278 [Mycena epipterygia]|nr:hypothetical protein C8R44DRAFT_760278 [Mycena epipterygia]